MTKLVAPLSVIIFLRSSSSSRSFLCGDRDAFKFFQAPDVFHPAGEAKSQQGGSFFGVGCYKLELQNGMSLLSFELKFFCCLKS